MSPVIAKLCSNAVENALAETHDADGAGYLFPTHIVAEQPAVERREEVIGNQPVSIVEGEFWTAKQRQASPLQEVSYRACFKPQLPSFFIERFSSPGDVVYDPFSGRGTTAIQAALLGRKPVANDINPLSIVLARPRVNPPTLRDILLRLESIAMDHSKKADIDISMFYEAKTEAEIVSLRDYLIAKREAGEEDNTDAWIRMVATNRLTGHSPGFFSVYSLPPNQAVSQARQIKINAKLEQTPTYRDIKAIIAHKSKQLLAKLSDSETKNLLACGQNAMFLNEDARSTKAIPKQSVQLTVTSPPFLDIVQYAADNWLRCWFNNIDLDTVASRITASKKIDDWKAVMQDVFHELYRISKKGAYVAFEVGEVRNGKVRLEEHVVPIGLQAGFTCEAIMINSQVFTKTANIWGVKNNTVGTNTNRIVVFSKS